MKEICLTKGKNTIVDDKDYEWLNQWNWYYGADGYAVRNDKNLKRLFMHRVIIQTPIGMYTDHIDGNRLNNQI
jgi:hypothetical protein